MTAKILKSIRDTDGNIYKTVRIGPQIWMAENLRVTHYRNGELISDLINGIFWNDFVSGAMCDYDNNPANSNIYGKLYNWYAVSDERKLAPHGWHVPSDEEWKILLNHLVSEIDLENTTNEQIIHLLRSSLTESSQNGGFNALLGGYRDMYYDHRNGPKPVLYFGGIGEASCWWTSSERIEPYEEIGIYRSLGADTLYEGPEGFNVGFKWKGFSVRCIKNCPEVGERQYYLINESNSSSDEFVRDVDGNVYKTIVIGSQIWMAENLKVTHYQNGDPINFHSDTGKQISNIPSSYCLNYENISSNSVIYGKLYNWCAINDKRKISPKGWHVPSDFEWTILSLFLGGKKNAGGKLKEVGLAHWDEPNAGATNDYGFSAIPAGSFETGHGFSQIRKEAQWWSSTEKIFKLKHRAEIAPYHYEYSARYYFVNNYTSEIKYILNQQNNARSVRCIKDFSFFEFSFYLFKNLINFLLQFIYKKQKDFPQPEIEWVTIPSGSYTTNNNHIGGNFVTFESYQMSKYAITFEQYDLFCDATGRKKPNDCNWGRGKRPVICIRWKDAMAFAEWMGCRLPTTIEWEYACQAGTSTAFNTGRSLYKTQANFNNYNSNFYEQRTLPVGSFEPNKWGLYDMHGNVNEWCSTCINSSPHVPFDKICRDGKRDVKGGSWRSNEHECKTLTQVRDNQDGYYHTHGFRIVKYP